MEAITCRVCELTYKDEEFSVMELYDIFAYEFRIFNKENAEGIKELIVYYSDNTNSQMMYALMSFDIPKEHTYNSMCDDDLTVDAVKKELENNQELFNSCKIINTPMIYREIKVGHLKEIKPLK